SVEVQFALIKHQIKNNELSFLEAINKLQNLRYIWRGDQLEIDIIKTLASLYSENKEYRKSLHILRKGLQNLKNPKFFAELRQEMDRIFDLLFIGGEERHMPAIDVLAIFDEFRQIINLEQKGAYVDRLISRLVELDLLDQALVLLQYQFDHFSEGPVRSYIGARIALIHLIEKRPQQALTIISQTRHPNIQPKLANERRRLRVHALIALGQYDNATRLLTGDITKEADLLRRNLFWLQNDWFALSEVLYRLIGVPPDNFNDELPADVVNHVFNLAVALRLNNDDAGIAQLRQTYGPFMEKTILAKGFESLTSAANDNINEIIDIGQDVVIGGNGFDDFIDLYYQQLLSVEDNQFYLNQELDIN
ncbi:MAG: hypothetical protein AAF403_01290, partial [Pseudomonadota bacterium]